MSEMCRYISEAVQPKPAPDYRVAVRWRVDRPPADKVAGIAKEGEE
jgi:hypothetical protein